MTQSQHQSLISTVLVSKEGDRYICTTVNNERIGASKYEDYWEYHLRR